MRIQAQKICLTMFMCLLKSTTCWTTNFDLNKNVAFFELKKVTVNFDTNNFDHTIFERWYTFGRGTQVLNPFQNQHDFWDTTACPVWISYFCHIPPYCKYVSKMSHMILVRSISGTKSISETKRCRWVTTRAMVRG